MRRKAGGRVGVVLGLASMLSACASWSPVWQQADPLPAKGLHQSAAATSRFDFDWLLEGSRQAAPLQVFDDGRRTWMQFSASQAQPRILAQVAGQWQLMAYGRQGPYLVLDHVWPMLRVQVGQWEASVQKLEGEAAIMAQAENAAPMGLAAEPPSQPQGLKQEEPAPSQAVSAVVVNPPGQGEAAANPVLATVAPEPVFTVQRADGHMRRTLGRWAEQAGWVFLPEHWSVDVDIPISADAVFGASFEEAVQALLAATDLSDRPLRPCFYANRVVRVVAYAQACDRSAKPDGAA